jgi:hypothetical protein
MSTGSTRLAIWLDAGPEADTEELETLTVRLRRELAEIDLESVEDRRDTQAPPGARAVDPASLGALLVTMAEPLTVLPPLVAAVSSLVSAGRRSARLEIDGDVLDVTGLSSADQRALISSWIRRHSNG